MKNIITCVSLFFIFSLYNVSAQGFGKKHTITSGGIIESIVVNSCDIDNDSDPDVLVTENAGGKILLYINNGGEFEYPRIIAYTVDAFDLKTSDFDKDGDQDILYTAEDNIMYIENLGNLNFSAPNVITTQIHSPLNLEIGDINNDNFDDILITGLGDIKFARLLNNGDGTFSSPEIIYNNNLVKSIICVDIDKDGDNDIVCGKSNPASCYWLENTNGNFVTEHLVYVDPTAQSFTNPSIGIIDCNMDNYTDILFNTHLDSLLLIKNEGMGQFSNPICIAQKYIGYHTLKTIDYDLDNDPDIICLSSVHPKIWILENIDGAIFNPVISLIYRPEQAVFTTGDVNNDGLTDIISFSDMQKYVGWFENSISAPFENLHYISSKAPLISKIQSGDFNNDNYQDIIIKQDGFFYKDDFPPLIFMNNGLGVDTEPIYLDFDNGSLINIITCDLNNDNYCDVLSLNEDPEDGNNLLNIFINDHDLNFSKTQCPDIGINSYDLQWINNTSGKDDFLLGIGDDILYKLEYNPDNSFTLTDSLVCDFSFNNFLFVDINIDGNLDFITSNDSKKQVAIYYGDESFPTGEPDSIQHDLSYKSSINIANINNDIYPDIIFSDYLQVGWFENIDGHDFVTHEFEETRTFEKVITIDINNDNYDEIVGFRYEDAILFSDINNNQYNSELIDSTYTSDGFSLDVDNDGDYDLLSYKTRYEIQSQWYENYFIGSAIDEESKNILSVFPNPTSNYLNINSEQKVKYVIVFNQLGQKVVQIENPEKTIDISSLNSGLYLVSISSEGTIYSKKIIIRK